MNCQTCQADLKKTPQTNELYCKNCGLFDMTKFQESFTPTGRETGFQCPACPESTLHVGKAFNTEVCFCQACRGFVIDRASLGELVETLRSCYDGPDDAPIPINQDDLEEKCCCPACGDEMTTFVYYGPGNVVLDTCESCNLTWFNEGELGQIVRAPGRRDYDRSSNFESSRLRAELYANAQADLGVGMWLLFG